MKHFEKLENFIKSNKNWEEILRPNMKSIYPVENRNWYVLMYNLMDMPDYKYHELSVPDNRQYRPS